ncbi:MAG: rhomboid family intramembrane serine protease [Fidelibacterota bacterium]|nr:MAG: rhomboid family intramembrane serine protease [Candidatus Neomarinimicrobiota bacterium]
MKKDEIAFLELLTGSTPRFFVTPIIIGINVLIFVVMILSGVSVFNPTVEEAFNWGANLGPYTLSGEWWRLFTSTFIHYGIIHLLFNMWVLWDLGKLAERMFGNWIFLILYLLSGLGGSTASIWWNTSVVSAGASGSVFGVVGGLIIFWYLGDLSVPQAVIKKNLTSLLMFTGYNLFYGFTESGIDNAAHLGGLAFGMLLGILLKRSLPPVEARSRLRYYLGIPGAMSIIILFVVLAKGHADDPYVRAVVGSKFEERGEYDKAIIEYKKALEIDSTVSDIYNDLGVAYMGKELYYEAISAYTRAIELDSSVGTTHTNLAIAYLNVELLDKAQASFKRAIEIDPKDDRALFLLGAIYLYEGFYRDATISFEKAIKINPEFIDALYELIIEDPQRASVAGLRSLYERMTKTVIVERGGDQEKPIGMRISAIWVKTEAKARQILQDLNNGADFSVIASQYSIGPGSENGGDLGFFAPGEMMKDLETHVINLQVGEYSGIIETDAGYLILLKIEENKPPSMQE